MAGIDATLNLNTVVNGADEAAAQIDNLDKKFKNVSGSFLKVGAGLSAIGAAGVVAITGFLNAASESEDALAQMQAVLTSTGGASGLFIEDLTAQASALQSMTKYSDEAIMSAQNMLLTFTSIKGSVFQDSIGTILDMSTALGTDLSGSSIMVGKALNDPISGIAALTRVGVTFTDEQKALIASLVEMGDTAGAQKVILEELNRKFGGSAEAAGQTFSGQLEILKNQFGEVSESLGRALMPMLQTFVGVLGKVADWLNSLSPTTIKWVAGILLAVTAFASIAGPILVLIGLIPTIIGLFSAVATVAGVMWVAITGPIGLVIAAILAVIAIGYLIIDNWELIKEKAAEIWDAIVAGFMMGFDAMMGIVNGFIDWAVGVWEGFRDAFLAVISTIASVAQIIWDGISAAIMFVFNAILAYFTAVWEAIKFVFDFALSVILGAVVLAFDAMGIDIIAVMQSIATFLSNTWSAIVTTLSEWLDAMLAALEITLEAIDYVWNLVWTGIKTFFSTVWEGILAIFNTVMSTLQTVWNVGLTVVKTIASTIWSAITSEVSSAWDFWVGLFNNGLALIESGWNTVWSALTGVVKSVWNEVTGIIEASVNNVISMINTLIQAANKASAAVNGPQLPTIPTLSIPALAEGGVVTSPTVAMIGEGAEPEAVLPLSKLSGMLGGTGGGTVINNYVSFEGVFAEEAAEKIWQYGVDKLKMSSAF